MVDNINMSTIIFSKKQPVNQINQMPILQSFSPMMSLRENRYCGILLLKVFSLDKCKKFNYTQGLQGNTGPASSAGTYVRKP